MAKTPIPKFLLTHRVVVAPYRAWDTFDAQRSLRCLVDERLTGGGVTGTQRISQVTVYLLPDADVPAGSRITLADGRQGYAQAVVRYDGGGLPTPDHLEVAVQVATSFGPAYGEAVAVLRRTRSRSSGGAGRVTVTPEVVPNAAVRMLSHTETEVGTTVQAVDTVEVVLPPGTQVAVGDALLVRGLTYEVDGTPVDATDPNTTTRPGVKVIGKRRY